MTSEPYKVAIIGYGLSAKIFHIPFIQDVSNFDLYGIVQRHPTPTNDAAKDFPNAHRWDSTEAMFADRAVDVVVVTTLPESHFALAKAALEAGKHVVVEKPFVPTYEEGRQLGEIAKRCGRLLTVYQNRRWDSDYLTLCKLLDEGRLGRVVEFETHFDRYRPENPGTWRQAGGEGTGEVYDLGTHLIDQVVARFGLPERITGFVGYQRAGESGEAGDSFTVLMEYWIDGERMLVTVKGAVVSPEKEQLRFWVRGDKGSFKKYHLDVQEDQLKEGKRPGSSGYGIDPESHYGVLTTVENGKLNKQTISTIEPVTYSEFYRLLAKAIAGEGEVPVSAEEAANVIRLVALTKESSHAGRTIDMKGQ